MLIRNILSAEYEASKSAAGGAKGKTTDSESDFPNRRRTQILAGLFATAAMTSYALSTGLLQVDLYFIAFKMFCFYYLQMFLFSWSFNLIFKSPFYNQYHLVYL